jgi:hypothetical protein
VNDSRGARRLLQRFAPIAGTTCRLSADEGLYFSSDMLKYKAWPA